MLRYWETEFPKIKPARSRSGQRLYKRRDIEIILQIKDLLYQKKFTIAGAKKHLQQEQASRPSDAYSQRLMLEQVREELITIRDLLNK